MMSLPTAGKPLPDFSRGWGAGPSRRSRNQHLSLAHRQSTNMGFSVAFTRLRGPAKTTLCWLTKAAPTDRNNSANMQH